MNENPEGTPNPLNQSPNPGSDPGVDAEVSAAGLDANPAEPMPVQSTTPITTSVAVDSLDPAGRPMEKVVPVEAPKKKSKAGLIVGIIIGLVVLVGAGVAAAIVAMNMNKPSAVAAAMSKLMSGETPKNVAIDGNIDILLNDRNSPLTRLNIHLDSNVVTGSTINTSSAVLTLTTRNNGDYSMKFDEVYATNGDLYFKVEGATAVLENSGLLEYFTVNTSTPAVVDCAAGDAGCADVIETNCTTDAAGTTNCETSETTQVNSNIDSTAVQAFTDKIIDVFETVDGEWLRISTDELGSYSSGLTTNSTATCVVNLVNDVNKNSNSTFELYNKYPFIVSTDEGVMIASKGNPVYQVSIDSKNFTNFVNSIQNAALTNDLYDCFGWSDNVVINEGEVAATMEKLPTIYVEVNGNNDFSRLYLESDINNGVATAAIDLSFTYPNVVNISEPVEYADFSNVIQEIMSSMFSTPTVQVDTESATTN